MVEKKQEESIMQLFRIFLKRANQIPIFATITFVRIAKRKKQVKVFGSNKCNILFMVTFDVHNVMADFVWLHLFSF